MEQWQVGPVPDYVYGSNPGQQSHPPNDIHNAHPYQQEMNRRGDQRMEFPYGGLPPNMGPPQQHHPQPVQPPMNVSQQQRQQQQQQQPHQQQQQQPPPQQQQQQQPQQAQTNVPPPQQPSAAQTPNAQNRNRKRPAPGSTPVVTPTVPPAQVPVGKAQSQTPNPPAPVPPAAAGTPVQAKEEVPPAAAAGAAAPPAKKSRTNTPWTPQEEQRLKLMRDQGNSWAEIAKTFPSRTEGSVKKHWYKDMHYAEFAEDESQALLAAIKDYENSKWKTIGQKVGKPAKACEQYAKEHFPDLFASNKRS